MPGLQVQTRAIETVVGRLLMAACADTSVSVRRTVLQSVQAQSPLDTYLAQADGHVSSSTPQQPPTPVDGSYVAVSWGWMHAPWYLGSRRQL